MTLLMIFYEANDILTFPLVQLTMLAFLDVHFFFQLQLLHLVDIKFDADIPGIQRMNPDDLCDYSTVVYHHRQVSFFCLFVCFVWLAKLLTVPSVLLTCVEF